jgi:hypothetical protein
MLLVAASVAVLIRQNGVLFSIILGVILTASLKGVRRWIIAGTACTVLVLVSLKSVVRSDAGAAEGGVIAPRHRRGEPSSS